MTELELLAPAKDIATAIAAIQCGADAVYIGASHHGARASASNSTQEIKSLCDYAHRYRVRVYVTLNTLVYENEIKEVESLVKELFNAGVDALIVQDLGLLNMDIPPIDLHASTQCDIRSLKKARFLENCGFSQIVLPREMSLSEIEHIHKGTKVKLEAFVHGALCVSYSGACRASYVNGGRSANRGECAQICRLPYSLIDGDGQTVAKNKHLLSLKDLCRKDELQNLIDAGVTSFKIEGRLKSVDYVKNVTAAYSTALNEIISNNADKYRRASFGTSYYGFNPDVTKSFNRGFIKYFPHPETVNQNIHHATLNTPKFVGEKVAKVLSSKDKRLKVEKFVNLSNGDGLTFLTPDGRFCGFRANKINGNEIYLTDKLPLDIPPGTVLYRNFDKNFNDVLLAAKSERKLTLNIELKQLTDGISLKLIDERGCYVTETLRMAFEKAKVPQKESRLRTLSKIGNTIYKPGTIADNVDDDLFIPLSTLSDLRRRTIELLDKAASASYPYKDRRSPSNFKKFDKSPDFKIENVANSYARKFYENLGLKIDEMALEVQKETEPGKQVRIMSSRYCIRRELGCCLKRPGSKKIAEPLKLISEPGKVLPMELKFDCKNCIMHVYSCPK